MKEKFILIAGLAAIAVAIFLGIRFFGQPASVPAQPGALSYSRPIRIGSAFFSAALATTEREREQGLSGQAALAADQALLMIFDTNDYQGIWMKDMKFPLDILWLTEEGKLIFMEENVAPSTYPQVFTPPEPARYVIELPAGTAEAKHIRIGDLLLY